MYTSSLVACINKLSSIISNKSAGKSTKQNFNNDVIYTYIDRIILVKTTDEDVVKTLDCIETLAEIIIISETHHIY